MAFTLRTNRLRDGATLRGGTGATLTPTPSAAILATVDPTVAYESLALTPSVSALVWAGVEPAVALGSLTITPPEGALVFGSLVGDVRVAWPLQPFFIRR